MRKLPEAERRRRVLSAVRRIVNDDFSDVPDRLLTVVYDGRPAVQELTVRETQIVSAASHGLEDKEIAEVLGLAYDTIRTHQKRINIKLAAKNRAHAAAIALRQGLIR